MRKKDAYNLCDILLKCDDLPLQEDWFELCGALLKIISEEANKNSVTCWNLPEKYPMFFKDSTSEG